jgi:hypothetical protein
MGFIGSAVSALTLFKARASTTKTDFPGMKAPPTHRRNDKPVRESPWHVFREPAVLPIRPVAAL